MNIILMNLTHINIWSRALKVNTIITRFIRFNCYKYRYLSAQGCKQTKSVRKRRPESSRRTRAQVKLHLKAIKCQSKLTS